MAIRLSQWPTNQKPVDETTASCCSNLLHSKEQLYAHRFLHLRLVHLKYFSVNMAKKMAMNKVTCTAKWPLICIQHKEYMLKHSKTSRHEWCPWSSKSPLLTEQQTKEVDKRHLSSVDIWLTATAAWESECPLELWHRTISHGKLTKHLTVAIQSAQLMTVMIMSFRSVSPNRLTSQHQPFHRRTYQIRPTLLKQEAFHPYSPPPPPPKTK